MDIKSLINTFYTGYTHSWRFQGSGNSNPRGKWSFPAQNYFFNNPAIFKNLVFIWTMLLVMMKLSKVLAHYTFVVLRIHFKLFTMKQTLQHCQGFFLILAFQGFEMQTFAESVFAKLRRSLDITEEDYKNSLCSAGHYLQFVSNSKSRADFFVTWAQCSVLLTYTQKCTHIYVAIVAQCAQELHLQGMILQLTIHVQLQHSLLI